MFAVDADVAHRGRIKRLRAMIAVLTLTGARSEPPTQGGIDDLREGMGQNVVPEDL
jgi:hypothetical protein